MFTVFRMNFSFEVEIVRDLLWELETQLESQLNDARVVAGRDYSAECARVVVIDRAFVGIDAAAR